MPNLDGKNEAMTLLWIIKKTQGIGWFFGDSDLIMHLDLAYIIKDMVSEFYSYLG